MKWNTCKQAMTDELRSCCRAINRPVVRKRIDAEFGIYRDKNASRPVVGFDVDGEWCYKLSCAIKVMAVILFAMWLWCRVSRFLRKLF